MCRMTTPVDDGAPHPLAGWLRARVATLRSATQRRNFPGSVELVSPTAVAGAVPLAVWTYGAEPTDHGLRVDVLTRLLTDCRCRDAATSAGRRQAWWSAPSRASRSRRRWR